MRWIGDWVLGRSKSTFKTQARLIAISGRLSAFVNNTPIVATVTEAVEPWSRPLGISPSQLLLPVNYATVLRAMTAVAATSPNPIPAGRAVDGGLPVTAK